MLPAFDGAGTCDHGKAAAADRYPVYIHYGIQRVEFPVGALERFLNTLDVFHDLHLHDLTDVDPGGIADQPENRLMQPFGRMKTYTLIFQPVAQIIQLLFACILFQNNDHFFASNVE